MAYLKLGSFGIRVILVLLLGRTEASQKHEFQ